MFVILNEPTVLYKVFLLSAVKASRLRQVVAHPEPEVPVKKEFLVKSLTFL